jgi:polyisoprenoid-binding protein YceI
MFAMAKKSLVFCTIAIVAASGLAVRRVAILNFSFQDPKGVNGVAIALPNGVEPIFGFGSGVTGNVVLDVNNPSKSRGKVVIDVKSIKLSSAAMTEKIFDEWCLDATRYPNATFEVLSGKVTKSGSGKFEGIATGNFSIKGVTKQISVPVKAYIAKDGVKKRFGQGTGDLLMVNCKFTFKRSDYGIGDTLDKAMISDEVEISVNVAGMATK